MSPENYFSDNTNLSKDETDDSKNYNKVILAALYECKENLGEKSWSYVDSVLKKLEEDLLDIQINYYDAKYDTSLKNIISIIRVQRSNIKDLTKIKDPQARAKAESLTLTTIKTNIDNSINSFGARLLTPDEAIQQLLDML